MPWYTNEGKDPHHSLRTDTQYMRNFAALAFRSRAAENQKRALLGELEKLLEANGFKKEAIPQSTPHRLSYVEKGYLDTYGFAFDDNRALNDSFDCSLYFNEPCSLAVTIGGRDLLTIRALLPGRAIKEAQSIASEAEELFDKKFEFAYSERFGYLSPSLERCGSGEIMSVVLFLPALSLSDEIFTLSRHCQGFGATLSPMFKHKGNPGDLYTVAYSPHHLCDRKAASSGFDALISNIISKEKQYEGIIFSERSKIIIDKAYRALGSLLYARRMSEDEMLAHLSSLRLLCAAYPDKKDEQALPLQKINILFAECLNASVASFDSNIRTQDELEEMRSLRIKELLNDKKIVPEPSITSKKV